jgi:hypothetical protein
VLSGSVQGKHRHFSSTVPSVEIITVIGAPLKSGFGPPAPSIPYT